MNCEKCGGECWDNRYNKKNPKSPDFKCKTCSHAVWLKPGHAAPAAPPKNNRDTSIIIQAVLKSVLEAYQGGKAWGEGDKAEIENRTRIGLSVYASLYRAATAPKQAPPPPPEPPPPMEEPPEEYPEDPASFLG